MNINLTFLKKSMEKGKGLENKFKIDETMFFRKTFLKISLCD